MNYRTLLTCLLAVCFAQPAQAEALSDTIDLGLLVSTLSVTDDVEMTYSRWRDMSEAEQGQRIDSPEQHGVRWRATEPTNDDVVLAAVRWRSLASENESVVISSDSFLGHRWR